MSYNRITDTVTVSEEDLSGHKNQILTSALRNALSVSARSRTTTTNSGAAYNALRATTGRTAASLDASNEEIWAPSPPDSPPLPAAAGAGPAAGHHHHNHGQMQNANTRKLLDADIADDDWNNDYADGRDDDAYFSYMRRSVSRWHPKSWLHKNRYILLLLAATLSIAAVVVIALDAQKDGAYFKDSDTDGSSVASHPSASSTASSTHHDSHPYQPIVILVSLDGFREEYLSRGLTPNLHALASSGVSASYMTPAFPSLTFPNHYSIVTGLHPESHGIVGNIFLDPILNDTFVYVNSTKASDAKWWGGEPLWVTTIKAGLKSATCMWPGSEAPIHNTFPTYYQRYNGSMPNPERITLVLSWLALPPEQRPSFLTLYISEVDTLGHKYGPDSPVVNGAIANADHLVGELVRGVLAVRNASSLQESGVNVVVVSDHGMAPGNEIDKFYFLDDYWPSDRFDVINNVVVSIYPKDSVDTVALYNALYAASQKTGHWQVWLRDQVPAAFHYSHNTRIGPIVALPDEGYGLTTHADYDARIANKPYKLGGMHGYNNSLEDMRAVFVAAGAAFRASGRRFNVSGSALVEEAAGGELGLDGEGHVVAAHGGAAVGGFAGVGRRRRDAVVDNTGNTVAVGASSTAGNVNASRSISTSSMAMNGSVAVPSADGRSSTMTSPALSNATATHAWSSSFASDLQLLPGFNNVEVYNLLLHVLKISAVAAPNNGTEAGMTLFKPWLMY